MKNPQAFPTHPDAPLSCDGMTLRDYFAAKAMQRLLTDDEIDVSYATAVLSYRMADAMLKAREE
jgi:hypothetical protein